MAIKKVNTFLFHFAVLDSGLVGAVIGLSGEERKEYRAIIEGPIQTYLYTRKEEGGEKRASREKGWERKEGLLNLRVLSDPKSACTSEPGALLSFENSPEILDLRSALFLSLADWKRALWCLL